MNRIAILALAAVLAGCASSPRLVPEASDDQRSLMLDQVKQLAGTWEMADENGAMQVASVFSVTSAGSAVREIMFPGHEHEMTNLYHMDGTALVMTHYCAAGNQPRLRADTAAAGAIEFKFDSISNLHTTKGHYMGGGMRLTITDADHITQEWFAMQDGKRMSEPAVFKMTRRK